MYRFSTYKKALFFNSLEEFMVKIIKDTEFANTLPNGFMMLQKMDNNDVFYEISRESSPDSQELYPSDFDSMRSSQDDKGFTVCWRKSKNTDSWFFFSITEWTCQDLNKQESQSSVQTVN
jgi:hypothetical protein